MMNRLLATITITLISLFAVVLLALAGAGCGDRADAGRLVDESEQLRHAATDRFRLQTAVIDSMVASVDSGKSLLTVEIEGTAEIASQAFDDALADLDNRSGKLNEAMAMELNDNYHGYLRLMSESNDRLVEALTTAAQIPDLILTEELVFSGWNQTRVPEVVGMIRAIEQQADESYSESEALRVRAEQLRENNPKDFE